MLIQITRACAEDAQALAVLKKEVEDPLYKEYGTSAEHELDMRRFTSTAYLVEIVAERGTHVFMAGDRQLPLGMIAVRREHGAPFLFSLTVRSRGQGVGTALLHAALQSADDATDVFCESFGQNTQALAFFARYGFGPVGQRPSGSYQSQILIRLHANLPAALAATRRRLEELDLTVLVDL